MAEIMTQKDIDELFKAVRESEFYNADDEIKSVFYKLENLFTILSGFDYVKDDKCEYVRKYFRDILIEFEEYLKNFSKNK